MLQMVLAAFVLYFLVEKMGGDDSGISSKRIVGIAFGALILQLALSLISKQLLWQLLALCVPGVGVWLALVLWCHLRRAAALKIAALYTVANFVFSIIVIFVTYKLTQPS